MEQNQLCRCGYTGQGEHLWHRCGKVAGSPRFTTYITCLAGMQTKFGAKETHGCDACWKEFNETIAQAERLAGKRV